MNEVLQAALNLLEITEINRPDLEEELSVSEWEDLVQKVRDAQESLEEVKNRLERGAGTESDLTKVAEEIIEKLTESEGVKKLLESFQTVLASKSERSYIIAGLAEKEKKADVRTSSPSELVVLTNRMIKRCEIIRKR
ncbi:MAG: hypothetical protein OEZ24_02540 [Candidatus Bathyarchaeota archaeon]|nr:hypothetical protein [Candidatus Bathyarchaeota archaeon]